MSINSRPVLAPADSIVTSVAQRRAAVVDVIRNARRDISLSLFRCNDPEIFGELERATARGVSVNVLVTPRAKGGARKRRKLWNALEQTGATIQVYAHPLVKYHAKYLVADDGPAVIASFNFTRKCFERTCDAFVLTHDPDVVSGLRALIVADRDGRPMPPSLTPRLIVGPERSRRRITALIERARSSIRVIDAKLSDPGLLRLLDARRRAGLAVEVFDSRRLGGLESHGKILLIDDRIAVIGSLALASVSLDFRREVAIAVEEPDAVAQVARLFRRIERLRTRCATLTTCQPHDTPAAAPIAIGGVRQEALC